MTLSPPWVPNLSASDDCSYFDPDLRAEDESKDSSKSGAAAGSSSSTKTVKGVYTQGKGTPTPKVCTRVRWLACMCSPRRPFPQASRLPSFQPRRRRRGRSSASPTRRPFERRRGRGGERHGERHLAWPSPVADAHDGAHTWAFMLRSASRWRCGPRRAPRGRWRHPISAWEIVMRELCRPAVTFCKGRPLRSVHGPSASSTT